MGVRLSEEDLVVFVFVFECIVKVFWFLVEELFDWMCEVFFDNVKYFEVFE